ncbi:hypothetical protein [Roseococcus sp. YIM B11640]|uniref:hypothetical protein n=1 Tax=Roseococcus sp. YIM B11640 TaxID=3133973 RepID=UPI003C7ACA0B
MERRRMILMGLAGAAVAALGVRPAAAAIGNVVGAAVPPPGAEPVQWGPPPGPPPGHPPGPPPGYGPPPGPPPGHWRRGRRCWNETRRVRYHDQWGRPYWRNVTRRVCR